MNSKRPASSMAWSLPGRRVMPARAMPPLEQAMHSLRQFGYRRLEGLYTTLLGEAHLLRGDLDTAHELALQGLAIAHETPYGLGTAWAQRALGRIALAAGSLAEAEAQLNQALATFAAMQARFEVGRTHLARAVLAQRLGHREAITLHLTEAHHLFMALRVPVYVQRSAQYARTLGLAFAGPAMPAAGDA
jgi:tetratricopeptide (TPR) repeat protein